MYTAKDNISYIAPQTLYLYVGVAAHHSIFSTVVSMYRPESSFSSLCFYHRSPCTPTVTSRYLNLPIPTSTSHIARTSLQPTSLSQHLPLPFARHFLLPASSSIHFNVSKPHSVQAIISKNLSTPPSLKSPRWQVMPPQLIISSELPNVNYPHQVQNEKQLVPTRKSTVIASTHIIYHIVHRTTEHTYNIESKHNTHSNLTKASPLVPLSLQISHTYDDRE